MKTKHPIVNRWLALTLSGGAFFLPGTPGRAVTLTGTDGLGASSFNAGVNWSDLLPPSAGKNYSTSNFVLRTPGAGSWNFLGDSLSIDPGGALAFKTDGITTVSDLRLNGGFLSHFGTLGMPDTATLQGAINLQADSNINTSAAGRTLVVDSAIGNGTGGVSAFGLAVVGGGTLTLNGFQGYTSLTSNAGTSNLNNPLGSATAALPTIPVATLTANATTNIGTSQNLAALNVGAFGVAKLENGGGKLLDTSALTIAPGVSGFSPGGQVDINDSAMVVRGASLATVMAFIRSGLYDGINGYWDGPGITSSAAANDANALTAVGVMDNAGPIYTSWPKDQFGVNKPEAVALAGSEILVKYTYYGDADLNGVVDTGVDYIQYLIGLGGGGSGWLYGDFDYNGVIDADADYNLFLYGLYSQGLPLVDQGSGSQQGSLQSAVPVAVPEPGTPGSLLAGALLLSARRRRFFQAKNN